MNFCTYSKLSTQIRRRIFLTTTVVIGLAAFSGCDAKQRREFQAAVSKAKPVRVNLKVTYDSRIVNGDFDYGVVVTVTIKNAGEQGIIGVNPWITCSDGEYSRKQNLTFAKGEQKTLTYFFPEPTINSSNVQGGVKLTPSR